MRKRTKLQLANRIAQAINSSDKGDMGANVWHKGTNIRIYVIRHDVSKKDQDCGFIAVTKAGIESKVKRSLWVESIAFEVAANTEIIDDDPVSVIPSRLSSKEAEAIVNLPRSSPHSEYDEAAAGLDRMYGKGGWDDRDLEDYWG